MKGKNAAMETKKAKEAEDEDAGHVVQAVPDGGWGWWIVFGCFVMHFLLGGFSRSFGVTYVELRKKFNSSAALTSMIGGVNVGLRFFSGPLSTSLSSRFSTRSTVFWGGVIMGVSSMLCGLMPNIYLMIIPYSIGTGIGGALVYSPGLVLVNKYFDKRRAMAAGLASSGSGLGVFLFPPLMESMFGYYGFFGAFLLLGALMLNNCVSAMLYRPPTGQSRRKRLISEDFDMEITLPEKEDRVCNGQMEEIVPSRQHQDSDGDVIPATTKETVTTNNTHKSRTPREKSTQSWWQYLGLHHFKNKPFLCFCAAMTLSTLAYVASQQLVIDFGRDLGIEDGKAVFLLSIIGILDMVGRVSAGFVFDIPRIKACRHFWYCAVMGVTGLTILATGLCTEYVGLATVCALHGLFNGAVVSQRSVVMTDVVGIDNLNSCFGLCVACQGVGVFVGPVVAGVLKDVTGKYFWSFMFSGSCSLAGALILLAASTYKAMADRKASEGDTEAAPTKC